ncbi:MAG: hypothetical protein U9N38_03780 [Thermodesulfobacteriota bacterium]|nr:hypothetical protein [Thermodesulfobacteriota bacterium]
MQEDLETKHQELKSLKSRLGETDRLEKTVTACKLRISELENKIYRERKLADKLKQKGASNSKQSPESESPSPALQEEITNLRNTLRQRNETIGAMRTDLSECNTLLEQAFRPDGKVAEMEKALKEYSRRISSLQEDVTRQQECLEEMEQSRAVDRREIETLTKEIARFRAMNPNNQEKPNRQESDLPKIAPRRIEPLSEQNEKLMGVAQEWSPRVPDSALLITEDKSPLDDSSLSFPQLEMNMRILPARDQ